MCARLLPSICRVVSLSHTNGYTGRAHFRVPCILPASTGHSPSTLIPPGNHSAPCQPNGQSLTPGIRDGKSDSMKEERKLFVMNRPQGSCGVCDITAALRGKAE